MKVSLPFWITGSVASRGPPTGEPGTRLNLSVLNLWALLNRCHTFTTGGAYKYAGLMLPPPIPPSWPFTEITSVKLYLALPPDALIELRRVVSVVVALTAPSGVTPLLSSISCRNIRSGCFRELTIWLATEGNVVELGARLST